MDREVGKSLMAAGNKDSPSPDQLAKLLELELQQKRAAWQESKRRLNVLRVISFIFLFLVIAAALLGAFFFFSSGNVNELRANRAAASPTPSAASTAP